MHYIYFKHKPIKFRFPIVLAIMLFIILSAVIIFKRAEENAVTAAENILKRKINAGISEIMDKSNYNADSFIRIEKNNSGEISAVISNLRILNKFSDEIQQMLYDYSFNTEIPLGTLSRIEIFKDCGPNIPLKISVSESSQAETENEILKIPEGSRFTVRLKVTACADIILPLTQKKSAIKTDYIIAEALILSQKAA